MIYYIGIHGPKRVGKDLFAANLQSQFIANNKTAVIDRLADPLYVWASAITGWPEQRLMGYEKDTPLKLESEVSPITRDIKPTTHNASLVGRTPRSVLLDLGVFVRERYGMDFLNNCLRARAENRAGRLTGDQWVLIPDVRTETEAGMCHLTFELSRDGCEYEGSLTEHAFVESTCPHIHLKTCDDASQACDFTKVYSGLMSLTFTEKK